MKETREIMVHIRLNDEISTFFFFEISTFCLFWLHIKKKLSLYSALIISATLQISVDATANISMQSLFKRKYTRQLTVRKWFYSLPKKNYQTNLLNYILLTLFLFLLLVN